MVKVGLLSDTHNYLHPGIKEFFKDRDEIWHCGDFGSFAIADELAMICPVRGVFGNIDGQDIRKHFSQYNIFDCEKFRVLMTHIGGYPGKYDKEALKRILKFKPGLFVCGHSHILKVMYDNKYQLMHMNPGAAGKYGMHKVITFVRFTVDGDQLKDFEIGEYERATPVVSPKP